MAILSSQKREEMRRNESFRRRPRKSSKPCRARTNSVADQFRFWPFLVEKTETPTQKSCVNKGKKMIGLALPNLDQELPTKKSCGKLRAEAKTSQESRKIEIIFKKKLVKAKAQVFPPPSAQLPIDFKNHMSRKLGATRDPVLVIEKRLFPSDVSAKLHRLSIPVKQVANHEFLTEGERKRFNNGNKQEKIDAILVEPSLSESKIRFKKWYIHDSGMYILTSGWNDVVERNGLKQGTLVQLWSFRKESQLYFALIRL
ncbi:B3 domain-containing protein At1g05920-like [Coffea arabica]|uniref:B3 domain-containing protein At1g05920-like n=1 Tax=Coffea arabica TaxID=13443 RepID=A0A6P6WYQ4_COFAR|nr:B3 domain-containing protein At1g05920-like [Coffea arabica]